jgi:hypothetical protein
MIATATFMQLIKTGIPNALSQCWYLRQFCKATGFMIEDTLRILLPQIEKAIMNGRREVVDRNASII